MVVVAIQDKIPVPKMKAMRMEAKPTTLVPVINP
jgi:hypothetical protein